MKDIGIAENFTTNREIDGNHVLRNDPPEETGVPCSPNVLQIPQPNNSAGIHSPTNISSTTSSSSTSHASSTTPACLEMGNIPDSTSSTTSQLMELEKRRVAPFSNGDKTESKLF